MKKHRFQEEKMDTKDVVKSFQDAVNEFYTSRLIIVEKSIKKLLELIVSTPPLYRTVSECAATVNYPAEFKKAASRDGVGGKFTLPVNRRHVVALVTGLLYEFDNKTLSIVDFVTGYFTAETTHQSYLRFCDSVIKPYADAFLCLIEGEPREISEALAGELALIPFPDKAKEDVDFWLRSLLDTVIGDNTAEEDARREYVTMIKGLLYVLDTRNPMLIKIVWIGLKNTLASKKAYFRELKEIEMILKTYGVID